MTPGEWDSLCDGCGRCCLFKLEYEETGQVYYTSVACGHLDIDTCRCTCYANRAAVLPECLVLTPDKIDEFQWLPMTCAYRRLSEGKELAWWHPLVSGDPDTVHQADISVRDKVISEKYASMDNLEAYILPCEL
jgi:uncharacterized cysteine cluster protein YcgN (CxxCxxCC family)